MFGLPNIKILNGIKSVNPLPVVYFLKPINISITRSKPIPYIFLCSTTGNNWSLVSLVHHRAYSQVLTISISSVSKQLISTTCIVTVLISWVLPFDCISFNYYTKQPLNVCFLISNCICYNDCFFFFGFLYNIYNIAI